MTTLKSFQAEIEAISHEKQKQAVRDAKEAHAAAELARHHGKLPKKEAAVVEEHAESSTDQVVELSLEAGLSALVGRRGWMANLQELITSESQVDELQSRLATSLLRGHGEVLVPLGAHPTPTYKYTPPTDKSEDNSTPTPTVGIALSKTQLDQAVERLRSSCRGLNAELNELYRVEEKNYGCWLVRLTPSGVEEIMEVRVAVVGNVDAGKSTTLGVLTRGGLDDGRGKVGDFGQLFPLTHSGA
jgi:hypothetical protein